MGHITSNLRRQINQNDYEGVQNILTKADKTAPDLIDDDYSQDCVLTCCCKNDHNVLHAAVAADENILQLLIQSGGDVNTRDGEGRTILHEALRTGRTLETITLIVEHDADLKLKDMNGFTALHVAVECELAVFRYILEVFKKVNLVDDTNLMGNSALHLAAKNSKSEVVQDLLRGGARQDIVNNYGNTPVEAAPIDLKPLFK